MGPKKPFFAPGSLRGCVTLGEPEQTPGHLHLLTETPWLSALPWHPHYLPQGPSGLGPGNPASLLSLTQGKKILPTYHGQQTNQDLQLRGQVNDTAER